MSKRRRFSAKFKSQVALEALKGQRTLSELAQEYGVHANQIVQWKKKLQDELPDIFSRKRDKESKSQVDLENELYRQIGQLKVELDWLKKSLVKFSIAERKEMIDPTTRDISIQRQCRLLNLSRSTYYYKNREVNDYNLHLMNHIDDQYLQSKRLINPIF